MGEIQIIIYGVKYLFILILFHGFCKIRGTLTDWFLSIYRDQRTVETYIMFVKKKNKKSNTNKTRFSPQRRARSLAHHASFRSFPQLSGIPTGKINTISIDFMHAAPLSTWKHNTYFDHELFIGTRSRITSKSNNNNNSTIIIMNLYSLYAQTYNRTRFTRFVLCLYPTKGAHKCTTQSVLIFTVYIPHRYYSITLSVR